MNIKKLYTNDNATKLLVKGINELFINAVRRSSMTNVSVLSIETINIYQNSSIIFDEFLGSRIGMIPIKTDLKSYKKGDKVKLTLNEEGPKTVYSKDIQCTDPSIEVAYKNIPIVKLGEGQIVKLEMEAEMNSGSEHSKFIPGLISFHQIPEIKTLKKSANIKEIAAAAPKGTIEIKGGKLVLIDPIDNYQVESILELDKDNTIDIEYKKNTFVLTIEPYGFLDASELIEQATEKLVDKCGDFETALKKVK